MATLVSCIMPTRGRPDFVLQSVSYFLRQDYPARELIILDDDTQNLTGRLPDDPTIRYIRVPTGLSIGAKRNQGCSLARGEIIAQWDDDDWYGPQRLSVQVAPLLAGQADITAFDDTVFCDLPRWQFWRCTPALHRRLFVEDVHGGTLVYRRELWQRAGGYPDRSLAEDAWFLRLALRQGGRLARLSGLGHFVYLRHGANAWTFACGQYLDPAGWQRTDEPPDLAANRAFYALRSPALASAAPSRSAAGKEPAQQRQSAAVNPPFDQLTDTVGPVAAAPSPPLLSLSFPSFLPSAPLVTCIMPTADRRGFVAQAIRYFQRQDYPQRELLILDDGDDPIADAMPDDPTIRYLRLPKRVPLGAKRNLACEAARGDVIAHWDDDDWQASWRLSYQVQQLLAHRADVCGVARVLYYQPSTGRAWLYVYPPHGQPWVAGNSLFYTRDLWCRNPFPAIEVGEDSRFLWSSLPKRLVALADNRFLVGLIHSGNTSVKRTHDRRWQPCATQVTAGIMGEDWDFYRV